MVERTPPVVGTVGLPDGNDFGLMLRRLRVRAGLSQNQLARRAGVDPAYVNRLERTPPGSKNHPSRTVVLGFWEALETTLEDRDRLLVAAGLCPEIILRSGGWDAYLTHIRSRISGALATVESALTIPPNEDPWGRS